MAPLSASGALRIGDNRLTACPGSIAARSRRTAHDHHLSDREHDSCHAAGRDQLHGTDAGNMGFGHHLVVAGGGYR